ncbi:MAG: YqjF family protein [Nakamurella sp.]
MTSNEFDGQGPPLATRQIMSQWWRDICFVHWRVDPSLVAPRLPSGTRPDICDGSAWVGLIPFRMVDAGIGRHGPVPRLGTFLEMNVRTYSVDRQGRHGVVFLSLEAERLAVVAAARALLGVPYQWATMSFAGSGSEPVAVSGAMTAERRQISYRSVRRTLRGATGPRSRLDVSVRAPIAAPSSRDLFLTARFGLHTSCWGRTLWIPNTHRPWALHDADIVKLEDNLVQAAGFGDLASRPPDSVLFAAGVRTVFGRPTSTR